MFSSRGRQSHPALAVGADLPDLSVLDRNGSARTSRSDLHSLPGFGMNDLLFATLRLENRLIAQGMSLAAWFLPSPANSLGRQPYSRATMTSSRRPKTAVSSELKLRNKNSA